jgi:dipeptidyl aminopeptidase/acylaminoacyl peptidase
MKRLLPFLLALPLFSQYQKPPAEVMAVLNSPKPPVVTVSPDRSLLLLAGPSGSPAIEDVARPLLRLAGYRMDPASNGPQLLNYFVSLTLQPVAGGAPRTISVPVGARITAYRWSPDAKQVAFAVATPQGTQLWVADAATAQSRKLDVALNAATGDAFEWTGPHALLAKLVPAGRGAAPVMAETPSGPAIQESAGGKLAPVRTNPDALRNPHDEALFDYYATAQLARVEAASGNVTRLGAPAVFLSIDAAPDDQHVLVTRLRKPYSYLHTAREFPRDIEVMNRQGVAVYTVAKQPLADRVPIGGVTTGARSVRWIPGEPATLVWVEAMDGGNPKEKVPHRDRLMRYSLAAKAAPVEFGKTEHRAMEMTFGENGLALVTDFERDRRWIRVFAYDLKTGAAPKLLFSRNMQDRYRDAGSPVTKPTATGDRVLQVSGGKLFLQSNGATPQGDRPFVDRYDLATQKAERLFQSPLDKYEDFVALLADDGSRMLIRRESATEPPNYFVREANGAMRAVTNFRDPAPQVRAIKRQLVTYKRADGVPLSFTLMLPPDYRAGTRLPAVVWAYPREFNDADTAGQISGSLNRFTNFVGASHLYFLLRGYAILDNAAMPVVGDPETVNNTYVEQIVASAKAAIDKAAEMGVIDPQRVGVGGHSYGAFMTANLLAHSDLFRAGIARSGAYNRTLTPFGFQSERRTFWEARDIYLQMSPFMIADKIKEPILFIHGEADNNQGTFPIQSERMYAAVRGNGGTTRLVMLPHESHAYSAKESIEHALFEMIGWFDKHVKGAGERSPSDSGAN